MTNEHIEEMTEEDVDFLGQLSEEDQVKVREILALRDSNQEVLEEIYALGAGLPATFFLALRMEILIDFLPPATRVEFDLTVEQAASVALSNAVEEAREIKKEQAGSGLIVPS